MGRACFRPRPLCETATRRMALADRACHDEAVYPAAHDTAPRRGPRPRRSSARLVGWARGLTLVAALLWAAPQVAGRSDGRGRADVLLPARAPALPDDGGPFTRGSAEQAQHVARLVAVAF